jgi:hypothetical protein
MAEAMILQDRQVRWGPAITGAFFAVACAIVLDYFGLAFGAGNYIGLSAVWLVLTPLVATFAGACAACLLAGTGSYLTGVMVWCISLVVGTIFSAIGFAQTGATGTSLALTGLACILGLCGALVGSAVGDRMTSRPSAGMGAQPRRDYGRQLYTPSATGRENEPPELRH